MKNEGKGHNANRSNKAIQVANTDHLSLEKLVPSKSSSSPETTMIIDEQTSRRHNMQSNQTYQERVYNFFYNMASCPLIFVKDGIIVNDM